MPEREDKSMNVYEIDLTEHQCDQLKYLVKEIEGGAIEDGKSGASLFQYRVDRGVFVGVFLPIKWAKQVDEIIKNYEKEDGGKWEKVKA